MGTNYLNFLAEGFIILKTKGFIKLDGQIKMYEIDSIKFDTWNGIDNIIRNVHNIHFLLFVYQKL